MRKTKRHAATKWFYHFETRFLFLFSTTFRYLWYLNNMRHKKATFQGFLDSLWNMMCLKLDNIESVSELTPKTELLFLENFDCYTISRLETYKQTEDIIDVVLKIWSKIFESLVLLVQNFWKSCSIGPKFLKVLFYWSKIFRMKTFVDYKKYHETFVSTIFLWLIRTKPIRCIHCLLRTVCSVTIK